MKKGCFLSAIFVLTILIGSGLYLYKKYGDEIIPFSKEKIIDYAFNELKNKVDEIEYSKYKDSLRIFIDLKRLQFNENAADEYTEMVTKIKYYINDGKIDSTEFVELKKYTGI